MTTALLAPTSLPVATASGWLALLQEPDVTLQSHALTKLLACVDTLWHEVAEALPDLEALAENEELPAATRQTAAAVASRVFFHLGEPHQALRLALEAGDLEVDVQPDDPYRKRLLSAALDAYIAHRRQVLEESPAAADESTNLPIAPLQALVHKLLDATCQSGHAADALGIALEAREEDQVLAILKSNPHLCGAALHPLSLVSNKAFRNSVLTVISSCLKPDQIDLRVLVHQLLNQPEPVATVLASLLKASEEDSLFAYQVCFDLIDSGDQAFVQIVSDALATSFGEEATTNTQCLQAQRILVGGFSSELTLSFLHKQSNADRLTMEQLKKSLEERGSGGRNSILHNAAVMTHAYLYAGTTNDSFLRDYLDWMKKASNW